MSVRIQNSNIHPTAIIQEGAILADDVEVGPYSVIGGEVTIGAGCRIGAHCMVEGPTAIGKNNRFFTGAVIGSIPQDMKYKGERTLLTIGDGNTFREYVTVNRGTAEGGGETRIGSHFLMMAYSHVAHDCVIGDHAIFANGVQLAGHVVIEERAILGGLAGVQQFVRVGKLAMIAACSKAAQDVAPFSIAEGQRAQIYGVNKIGLKRAGFSEQTQRQLEQAFRFLFRSGLSTQSAIQKIQTELPATPELTYLVQFIQSSQRGFCKGAGSSSKEESPWNG